MLAVSDAVSGRLSEAERSQFGPVVAIWSRDVVVSDWILPRIGIYALALLMTRRDKTTERPSEKTKGSKAACKQRVTATSEARLRTSQVLQAGKRVAEARGCAAAWRDEASSSLDERQGEQQAGL